LKITILDAHVHIHDCFAVSDLLSHAHDNFHHAAREYGDSDQFHGVLLLTESSGKNWFHRLRDSIGASTSLCEDWSFSETDETSSLEARSTRGRELSIVAGRQIVTAERLEILALGLVGEIRDGRPIDEVMHAVQATGALCVLPWGFGKWTGRRLRVVRRILDRDLDSNFFLGDNAARPALWPAPSEFAMAAEKNIRILPGSDPLPFRSQVSTVARFGFVLDRAIDRSRPFQEIRRLLLDGDERPKPYGSLERLLPFVRNQLAMQLRKYLG
jgi:hypothetical protein